MSLNKCFLPTRKRLFSCGKNIRVRPEKEKLKLLFAIHERGFPSWFWFGSPWLIALWLLGRRFKCKSLIQATQPTCILVFYELLLFFGVISLHSFEFGEL